MMPKQPPISSRDSGGSFSINNPDDGTPIKEMFTLGEGLLFVTEKCTYRLQVADQIDPGRKNPALPHNVRQKIFDHGTKSQLLCNTLLLAKVMFRKEFLQLDVDRAMQLAFDALGELVAMHEAAQDFAAAERSALEVAQQSPQQNRSLAIPSVGNVRAHCKTFMQKADHFAGALLNIVRLFYPDRTQMNWDDFEEIARVSYGEGDNFTKVVKLTKPLLQLVRNARDCLEHRNTGVTTTDFALEQDGTLAPPTIAVDFRQTTQERCPISWFMDEIEKALLNSFEMIIVHLCSKHVQPFPGMPIVVALLPENYQTAWHVRFGYGMYYQDGQFTPIG
jgi:hypothetical protein